MFGLNFKLKHVQAQLNNCIVDYNSRSKNQYCYWKNIVLEFWMFEIEICIWYTYKFNIKQKHKKVNYVKFVVDSE